MNTVLRRAAALVLGMLFCLGWSLSAAADEPALSVFTVRVQPGKVDDYLARVKQLQGALNRLEGKGSIEAWEFTIRGPADRLLWIPERRVMWTPAGTSRLNACKSRKVGGERAC